MLRKFLKISSRAGKLNISIPYSKTLPITYLTHLFYIYLHKRAKNRATIFREVMFCSLQLFSGAKLTLKYRLESTESGGELFHNNGGVDANHAKRIVQYGVDLIDL